MRDASDFGLKKGIKRAENMLPHPDGRTELGLMRARPEMKSRCDPKASAVDIRNPITARISLRLFTRKARPRGMKGAWQGHDSSNSEQKGDRGPRRRLSYP